MENNVQQRAVHHHPPIVLDKAQLANLFIKRLTRDRVVPIISASVSWLIFGITGSGLPFLPK